MDYQACQQRLRKKKAGIKNVQSRLRSFARMLKGKQRERRGFGKSESFERALKYVDDAITNLDKRETVIFNEYCCQRNQDEALGEKGHAQRSHMRAARLARSQQEKEEWERLSRDEKTRRKRTYNAFFTMQDD